MSLVDTLNADLKVAMKAHDKVRVSTIRLILTDLKNERIKLMRDLNESDELTILSRQAKQRRESIEAFTAGGRPDAAAMEQAELVIVESYLPQALTAEDVVEFIRSIIAQTGAASRKDFGKVMGPLMPKIKGRFPGHLVKPLVEAELDRG